MQENLAEVGTKVDSIPVSLRYRMIELFSGHLYSSPTKAIEELVVNSYDAFATLCIVSIPDKIDGLVWVFDNGDSMDLEGLKELWLVAESRKRLPEREAASRQRGRLSIGKFGIGKLASYVLGRRITHVCKRDGTYLAVTMDYAKITGESDQQYLSVRKLTEAEVKRVIPFLTDARQKDSAMPELLSGGLKNWTVVVVDELKELLQIGRLNWILSTALPLAPDFQLFLNGSEVKSSKERIKRLAAWQIGNDDKSAKSLEFPIGQDPGKEYPFDYFVELPKFGKISGTIELFVDPIDTGKSSQAGHSNGFFVMARKRLINTDDNLFGITTLPFLGFNHFRAVVQADFLDDFLTANREDTTSNEARETLQKYLIAKFNEARLVYERYLDKQDKKETLEEHLETLPGTLLTYPLRQAMERIVDEKLSGYSIKVDPDRPIVNNIRQIQLQSVDSSGPLATFEDGNVVINANHPFYQSFADTPGVRKFVIAEVLLEAYLLDAGVEPEKAAEILTRRDQLLRSLVGRFPEDAIETSEFIKQSLNSETDLEIACTDGFRVLGFDSTHIGGSGKPDGIAIANLGIQAKGLRRKYTVTFDAKSTQSDSVKSGNLGLGTVATHMKKHSADYCAVIATEYQLDKGEKSKCVQEAKNLSVCLLRARDFADLVASSAAKPLSLERLQDLFKLYSPFETQAWIKLFKEEKPAVPPIKLILGALWKMQTQDTKDVPQFSSVRYEEPSLKRFSKDEIREWLLSLSRLQPELIVIVGDKVQLNQTPDNIITQCVSVLKSLSPEIAAESMLKGLAEKKA